MAQRKKEIAGLIFPDQGEDATDSAIEMAMKLLDKRDRLEKTVLTALRNSKRDYYNAFCAISRNTRFIYVHAY